MSPLLATVRQGLVGAARRGAGIAVVDAHVGCMVRALRAIVLGPMRGCGTTSHGTLITWG